MQVTDSKIDGVKIIQPKVFGDARGFFLETFEKKALPGNAEY
ncbi:dTDP-4-dehydrorhamnose 3,5-epimerase [Serratia rubidaea]|uniref:dTDP-4-dehydrorhamnose 3,5-epimerase n=1 Tax=Serratia rubidaea TaxID=61652 RepID=A0A4U9HCI7_SERRU|nr:dTDP-4-dehydrorhamnose 3,5-epimerase [Serratia rubidaea]